MSTYRGFFATFWALSTLVLASACGPTTFTKSFMIYEPYESNDRSQTKDGITVELMYAEDFPPTFYASVQSCDQYGRTIVDSQGNPVMETVSYADEKNQFWEEVALTNNTANVIRMNGVVIRLFDPAGNQYELLAHDDLMALLQSRRPCMSTMQVGYQFKANKVFSRNMEVVPGTTSTFWVPFLPSSKEMEGVWKFVIYDVPVRLDAAGNPIRKTQFDMRMSARKVTQTYSRANPFEQPTLIGTSGGEPRKTGEDTAAPAPAPGASAADPPYSSIAGAQQRLNGLGYDAGPADGIPGKRTRAALSAFQRDQGLPETGELDSATIEALGQ